MNISDLREKINQNLSNISVENLEVIAEFIEFIKAKQEKNLSETMLLSESSLAKDWLIKEEDEAWKNL